MAVVRRGKRRYIYRSIRKGGRVTSVYVRPGDEFDVLLAQADALCDAEERRRQAAAAAERARYDAEDAPVIAMFREVETIARAALEASGHYQHRRSEWRRRGDMQAIEKSTAETTELPGPDVPLRELVRRAKEGDPKTRERLRALLERGLDREFAQSRQEMTSYLNLAIARSLAGDDVMHQEIVIREVSRTTDELAGPNPSAMERLLAHRVAVCKFEVDKAQFLMSANEEKGNYAEAQQHRLEGAHRRFLQACKMLATVRRMAAGGPRVQVQVNQMVNVEAKGNGPSQVDATSIEGMSR